jgi:phosphoribosylformimino-5-aminoimidazole carboxamide ribotide isomerase
MKILPAIDIRGGHCVRLHQGDYGREKVYDDDPVAVAKRWEAGGAEWIHLVDLDGAKAGAPVNHEIYRRILSDTNCSCELGGGVRDIETIGNLVELGMERVIIGTAAVRNPEMISEACGKYPGKIAIGLDARDGKISVAGWMEDTDLTTDSFTEDMIKRGVGTFIFTDISRDGTLTGPNIDGLKKLAGKFKADFVASGGISSLEDIRNIKALNMPNIIGIITGIALYENKFTVEEAIAALKE